MKFIGFYFLFLINISLLQAQNGISETGTFHAFFMEDKGYIQLTWNEIDNEIDQFILERSSDGINFNKIETKIITDSINLNQGYIYKDAHFHIGYNYYKITTISNQTGISKQYKAVTKAYRAEKEVLIFPNPATEFIKVSLYKALETEVQLLLTDALGKTILQEEGRTVGEHWYFELDVSQFASGIYFIRIISDKKSIILQPQKVFIHRKE